jgi:signal transduction histidine kinase
MIQAAPDERLIEKLFDTQPDSVVWFSPLFNESGTLVDFEVRYCNAAAAVILRASREKIIGSRLQSSVLIDRASIDKIFAQSLQVWESGQTVEFTYHNAGLDRYFNVQRSKILDGVLSITRDRTHEVKLELEKQQQAALLEKVINSTPACIVLCQAVRNEEGVIDDFKLLMVNEKIAQDLQRPRKEIESMTYCELHPGVRTNGYLTMLTEVATTGKSFRGEMYLQVFGGWFFVSADKVEDDRVIVVCLDINQTKKNEKRIHGQAMLLNKVIEQSPSGISWYLAQRNDKGEIVDFHLQLANQKSAEITGFTLEELQRYTAKELMQIRNQMAFFERCVGVVENRQPLYTEFYSISMQKWVALSVAAFEDGYLLHYLDITNTRKIITQYEEQTTLLQSILDGSINGLFALEAVRNETGEVIDFMIVKINKAFQKILGLGEEVVGQYYLTVFPGSKAAGAFDHHVQVLKTGVPVEFEIHYTGDGYNNWFRISITRSGENGLVQTFTDISESAVNKLSLQEAATQLQAVIDSTQTGIFLASPVKENGEIADFRFKAVNNALAAYAQRAPSEITGGLHGQWFPVYRQNGVFEKYKRVCDTGIEERFQQQYVADGFDVWMDVMAKKLGDDLLVSFHDYTSLKQLQLQLEASIHDLKKTNERLADFAYVASHDLKEPLRKVRMQANLLEERFAEALGESGLQHILRIQTAVIRMQTLITDLLAYSQVSKKPEEFKALSLVAVVNDVLSDLEATIQATNARIQVSDLPEITGDNTQLRQLFQNLLSNALKFTDPTRSCQVSITAGTVSAQEVSAESLPYRRYHRIVVADNGIGFDQQYREKIFKIFHRLHSNTEYEGTGIGLAIVQRVMENHQGWITASGESGKGASFELYFPV